MPWLRVVPVGLGMSVVPLDTAVNIAFPDITRDFALVLPMIQWVVICYMLTHAGLMLAFGRAGDIWGHAKVFRAGLAWSGLAFLLCAAAPSFGWLLLFRGLQGIGAGLIISCAPALVTSLYPEARRGQALGLFTLVFALGSALGPLLGGLLAARWGWPGVFWFRAPIALGALALLREQPLPAASHLGERFDVPGAALLALGLGSLLLALNALAHTGSHTAAARSTVAMLLAAIAVAGLGGFVWWEARASHPMLRLDLFRNRRFAAINIAAVLLNLASFSVLLFAPYFFDRFGALPLPLAGAVLGAGFVGMAAASPAAGWMLARIPADRLAATGALAAGVGLFLVGRWQTDTAPLAMGLTLALQGWGIGLFQVAYMEAVMAGAGVADRGVAGSLSMMTRTLGVIIAAAMLSLAFAAIEGIAAARGGGADAAFLAAFSVIFRGAGAAAGMIGVLIALTARARR